MCTVKNAKPQEKEIPDVFLEIKKKQIYIVKFKYILAHHLLPTSF